MTYLTWSEDLAVGNHFIDGDHRKLIDMVNRLHVVMQEGRGKEVLGKVLHNLIVYTQEHFTREEDLMRRLQYDNIDAHKREHEKLLQQVLDMHQKFETGTITLSVQLLHFLRDWLIEHIGEADKKLAAAARELAS